MTLRSNKEKVKTSIEELGKFFYDLSKTSFTVMVAGATISLFTMKLSGISFCYMLSVGLITTFLFARMGYVVLNQRIKVD